MPVTKSAAKALRQSQKKRAQNQSAKTQLRSLVRQFKKRPSQKLLLRLYSALDRAAKNRLIHKNKAARLKSRFSRSFSP